MMHLNGFAFIYVSFNLPLRGPIYKIFQLLFEDYLL